MANLTRKQKVAVVARLATFEMPADVRTWLKEECGVEISLQAVCYYDPTNAQGARELSQDLKDLFFETRARYLDAVADIPIADRRYRLLRLQQLLDLKKYRENAKTALAILEQAAKEAGGAYTNRRELTGAGGGPIEVANVDLSRLTDEELTELEQLLARAEGSDSGGGEGGAGAPAGSDVQGVR
ncbi:MAG: DUF2280 domain-containing protein [Armatimonadota bacterium]